MNAFRKRKELVSYEPGGSVPMITHSVSKTVVTDDCSEPTTFVEMVTEPVEDYALSLGLPRDEDYKLRDMIAAGRIPEEVPVSGMLDSHDPTDLSNVGVGDAIFSKLSSAVDASAPADKPAPASSVPASDPALEPAANN